VPVGVYDTGVGLGGYICVWIDIGIVTTVLEGLTRLEKVKKPEAGFDNLTEH